MLSNDFTMRWVTFYNETRKQKKKKGEAFRAEGVLAPALPWTGFVTLVRSPLSGSCFQNITVGRMDFKGRSVCNSQDQHLDGFHPRPSKLLQITLWIYCPPVNSCFLKHQLLNQGKTFFKSSNSSFTTSQILTFFGSFLFIITLVSES